MDGSPQLIALRSGWLITRMTEMPRFPSCRCWAVCVSSALRPRNISLLFSHQKYRYFNYFLLYVPVIDKKNSSLLVYLQKNTWLLDFVSHFCWMIVRYTRNRTFPDSDVILLAGTCGIVRDHIKEGREVLNHPKKLILVVQWEDPSVPLCNFFSLRDMVIIEHCRCCK